MKFWECIFLGLVQGVAEFLPISSSGHLILLSKILEIESDLSFDVFLHFGTLAAVVFCYRKTIVSLFTKQNSKTLLYLVLASVPTFAIAFVVKMFIPFSILESLLPLGFALTIVLLILIRFAKTTKPLPTLLSSIITGVVQGIAVLPGLSRSGSTIATMSFFGINKEKSAEFSFLLSIPVILASVVVEGYTAIKTPLQTPILNIIAGVAVAAVVGFFAIKVVQLTLKKSNFTVFAFYLAIPLILSLILL
ncbi:MAG TPA: undecaprenyl-diphosphate phosphatase [Clostridia bacterium]|nr:undecaprenyl-diphosphate phosphatase [Clostridia bacterium]